MGAVVSCFVGALHAVGDCLMTIVNAIGAVLTAIISGFVAVCRSLISCLTCGWYSRRRKSRGTVSRSAKPRRSHGFGRRPMRTV